MIVIMNKLDKVDETKADARRKQFRKLVDAEIRDARGQMLDEIAIMPCALVTNPQGTKLVDSVIAHLAKSLAK